MIVHAKFGSDKTLRRLDRVERPMPIVRWTRYGRWTPDGLYVVNNRNEVIYRHPLTRGFVAPRKVGNWVAPGEM